MRNRKGKHRKAATDKAAFTRRDFLRGAGVAVSGGLLVSGGAPAASPDAPPEILGPGAVPITLKINGASHNLSVEPRLTLLDVLRNDLDLTGAKRVCDRGTCGACTVIMDGMAVYACDVLAIEAQGREITTIESLSRDGHLHPVMQAFIDNDAQQCGFCTPGFVMAAKAFLELNPNPSYEQVKAGLGGNLCRCGTYMGVRKAVLQAAKEMKGAQHA
jgi:xanthine dehydrogenase YagT iron-sulfur-binding subunit